eukprot:scaffold15781_cov112-Isochrysis_galbana.AAC.1
MVRRRQLAVTVAVRRARGEDRILPSLVTHMAMVGRGEITEPISAQARAKRRGARAMQLVRGASYTVLTPELQLRSSSANQCGTYYQCATMCVTAPLSRVACMVP